jgi:hypothetical protein
MNEVKSMRGCTSPHDLMYQPMFIPMFYKLPRGNVSEMLQVVSLIGIFGKKIGDQKLKERRAFTCMAKPTIDVLRDYMKFYCEGKYRIKNLSEKL